jgi:hypothetical protein
LKNVRQGAQDFYKGQVVNPHHPDSQAYREWEFGFNQSYFKNLERQKEYERKFQQARA